MSLGWEPWSIAQLEGGGVRLGIVLRIDTDPVIRLWSGVVRDLALPADAVESEDGAIYQSMGLLTDLPVINQLINGQAERVQFGISGAAVTPEVAALASEDASSIRGVAVSLGILVFDVEWQQNSPVAWLWDGEADSLTVERQGDAANPSRSIKLSVGSLMTGRRRPQISYFTDADQKRRSADDTFFSEVRRYTIGSTKVWPV